MYEILRLPAYKSAPLLLGWVLEREMNGQILSGVVVETEAYDQSDAASHSFKGVTPRTEIMFGPAGRAYVYFTYGMHYCMNVVVGAEGEGSAILIRALEPITGLDTMNAYRGNVDEVNLTNGPAKLGQALQIDKNLNGHVLSQPPLRLIPPNAEHLTSSMQITQTTRIGITKDIHRQWRFYLTDNKFVSKK